MSYAAQSGLGESYQVEVPVYGKTKVELPVAKIASDAMEAALKYVRDNADSTAKPVAEIATRRLYDALEQGMPAFVDTTMKTVQSRLDAQFKERTSGVLRGMLISTFVAGAVFCGGMAVMSWRKAK